MVSGQGSTAPWLRQAKCTGLLNNPGIKDRKVKVKATQTCPTLCDPMNCTVHGILQARILEWVAYPFSSESSWLRNQTGVSCIAGRFFTNWAIRESQSQEPKSHLILCHILLQQRIEISNTHTHTQEWRWGREDKPCFWLFLQKYPTSVHDPNSEYMFMAAVNTAKKPAPTGTVTHGDLGKEECSLHEAYNFNFLF